MYRHASSCERLQKACDFRNDSARGPGGQRVPALKLNEPCAMDELTHASTMTNRYDGIGFAVQDQRRCSDSMGVSG